MPYPVIPEHITVHLGRPNSNARNITVSFPDYIKNVASSEIYPTWPDSALRANILAQISFALNRIYNEHYRSLGYDFDITSSTAYDQSFVENRTIYNNISRIVDEIFNSYVTMGDQLQPYFTAYCSGRGVDCEGLKQWDTVALAEQGFTPYEILQYFYGDDINIVTNVPVRGIQESYPGAALRLGSVGDEVAILQRQLNRIGANYPAIPRIPAVNGVFDRPTRNAVMEFQRIFGLNPDGIVGEATWYKIKRIYNGVKRLSELYSEGITISEVERLFQRTLRLGDTGTSVGVMQYYLDFISQFNNSIPTVVVDSNFGPQTQAALRAFQREYGLVPDGIAGSQTWNKLQEVYIDILNSLPNEFRSYSSLYYPGYFIASGATGQVVQQIQTYLHTIAQHVPEVPDVEIDSVFGPQTQAAVEAVQRLAGIYPQLGSQQEGLVGPLTWNAIVNLYNEYR